MWSKKLLWLHSQRRVQMENKKKKKTQIDIILPNFNSHKFVVETIKSIINQSYSNWKLIIVDDHSNEQTKEKLKKFLKNKKIKIYWLKKIMELVFAETMQLKKATRHMLLLQTRMIFGKKIS